MNGPPGLPPPHQNRLPTGLAAAWIRFPAHLLRMPGRPATAGRCGRAAGGSGRVRGAPGPGRRRPSGGTTGRLPRSIELYQNTVYGFLRARLLEPADAEDLCQEVFLRCYLGREKLSRAAAVGPWLIGIARNILREHVRRVHRRKEVAWTELCLELDALASEHEQRHDEALAHLPVCLDSLGQSAREAIDLRYRHAAAHGRDRRAAASGAKGR